MLADPQEIGSIPVQLGKDVYIRDVAKIQDTTDINYGCALVNGRKSIYIPVVKKDTASTLTVVRQIHDAMPLFRRAVPEDVSVRYEFDESPTVRAAIKSVATEGAIGAALTGLMILLFLHDLRSVVVVLISIPLSLTSSLVGLWLTGNTINIMSLGGLALAIGILVDEATVTIENTHAQMRHTRLHCAGGAARERHHGHGAALGHALHSVGVHSRVHPQRAGPLAVHAVDAGGRLRHDRLLPALQHAGARAHRLVGEASGQRRSTKKGSSIAFLPRFASVVAVTVRHRWIVVFGYLAACGVLLWLVGGRWARSCFPRSIPASSCFVFAPRRVRNTK